MHAAKVRSEITQAGALGDPYGSGMRTIWWVYGVGPVKVVFQHAGGSRRAGDDVVLQTTNQTPKPAPADANYFPLTQGAKITYSWTNTKHLTKPSVQRFTVDHVVNGSARFTVGERLRPDQGRGAYGFTTRPDGVTNLWGTTQAASLAKFPPLGPRSQPTSRRRHFFTPFDLMTFGFNPLLPAYPGVGTTGTRRGGPRLPDVRRHRHDHDPRRADGEGAGGTFRALAVRTTLKQAGFPFGSGTRTSWFAPGRGLVKLVFQHGDGSEVGRRLWEWRDGAQSKA